MQLIQIEALRGKTWGPLGSPVLLTHPSIAARLAFVANRERLRVAVVDSPTPEQVTTAERLADAMQHLRPPVS